MEPEHLQHLDLIRSEYLHRKHSRIEGHIFYSENAHQANMSLTANHAVRASEVLQIKA